MARDRGEKCYSCKATKENRTAAHCNACKRKRDNEWRLRTGRTKRHQTGLCQCGQPRASYSPCYCKDCAAKINKIARKKYKPSDDVLERKRARYHEWYRKRKGNIQHSDLPEHIAAREKYKSLADASAYMIVKHRVRSLTRAYIKAGKLKRLPCEICGTNEAVQAHHDDYDKPMDVRWLCRKHHAEHHKNVPHRTST